VDQAQNRSTFITVMAWIFIVVSGFCTVISILQNIMIFTVFRSPEFNQALQAPPPPDMPPIMVFMINNFHILFIAFLIFSVFILVSSVGLLKRWNWARLCFIGIMVLGIIWNLGGIALQFIMFSSMQEQFAANTHPDAPDMQFFVYAIEVISVLFAVGFSILFGWITKCLLSPKIIAEFRCES